MKAYTLKFSDGRSCTFIDPDEQPVGDIRRSLKNIFYDRLISVTEGLDAESVTDYIEDVGSGS